jgi:hypothetical protein
MNIRIFPKLKQAQTYAWHHIIKGHKVKLIKLRSGSYEVRVAR